MAILVPESYRSYCKDEGVRRAVTHLLAESDKGKGVVLPADFEWRDLPSFHRAVLSAYQVRCEYAIFLIELWDATWGWALQTADLGASVKLEGALDSHRDSPVDALTVWRGWFHRKLLVGDTHDWLSVGNDDDDGTVGLWISDGPDASALGSKWVGKTDDNGHFSEKVTWSDAGQVDPKPLREAAAAAIRTIGTMTGE